VDLDPGQVVRIVAVHGGTARVRAARGLVGDVPASALLDTHGNGR